MLLFQVSGAIQLLSELNHHNNLFKVVVRSKVCYVMLFYSVPAQMSLNHDAPVSSSDNAISEHNLIKMANILN